MEELHISKASLLLALMKCIGLNPQPCCSGSHGPCGERGKHRLLMASSTVGAMSNKMLLSAPSQNFPIQSGR